MSDDLLSSRVSNISIKYDFTFFNLTDIRKIGGKNTEFVDYIHGTDKLFLRSFLYMYKNSKILDPYVDVNYLEAAAFCNWYETMLDILSTCSRKVVSEAGGACADSLMPRNTANGVFRL